MTKCALFLADGFEPCEALIPADMLRRAGFQVDLVSISDTLLVNSSQNIRIEAEKYLSNINPEAYDVLILPGGKRGTENLEACEPLKQAFLQHYSKGKLTCAICAAPSIFGHLGMLKGKAYTCFPDFDDAYGGTYKQVAAVKDGNLITGRGMGASIEFARLIIRSLDAEKLNAVEHGIQYGYPTKDEV